MKETCVTCSNKTNIGGCEIKSDNKDESISIKRPLSKGEIDSIKEFGCIRHNE